MALQINWDALESALSHRDNSCLAEEIIYNEEIGSKGLVAASTGFSDRALYKEWMDIGDGESDCTSEDW